MIFNMTGSGGAPLNFKVVPNPQPDTAKENTIWVDTDRINNYYFSAEQPENMVDYDVWISTGTSSTAEFNALKKNGIQVYPISAKQYVNGAWVDKTAKTYQNGKWVEWIVYFLDGANQYAALTGGWTGNGTVDSNGISMESGNIASFDKYMCTVNPIDFTQFKTIKFNVTRYFRYNISTSTHWVKITVRTAKNGGGSELATLNVSGQGVETLNVENVNQSGYLTIQTGNTSYITVKTIFA